MIDAARLEALRFREGIEEAPGVAVAVLREGRVADVAATGRCGVTPDSPLHPWTKMRVASLSKLPVAMAALRLHAAGRLALDASVDEALGFRLRHPDFPDDPITLAHLFTHTAGLADGEVYWGTLGERLADFFTPSGARWENGAHFLAGKRPGAWFSYCNLGYGIAATVIERAAGARFDQAVREAVFDPLGLTCGYNWSGVPALEVAQAGAIYRAVGGGWTASVDAPGARREGPALTLPAARLEDYTLGENGLLFSPQGGLRASVMDVAALGAALLLADFAPMRRPVWTFDPKAPNGDPYGGLIFAQAFGAQVLTPEASPIRGQTRALFGHSGEAYGLVGGVWIDPETRAGFAYLVNGEPATRAKGTRSKFYAVEEGLTNFLGELAFGR